MIGFMDAVKQVAGEAALRTLAKEAGRVTDEILEALQVRVKDFALPALSEYIDMTEIDKLYATLKTSPVMIRGARINVEEHRKFIREMRRDHSMKEQEVKEAEVAIIGEIASDPTYTNEKMRTAELMKRKKIDQTYQEKFLECQGIKTATEEAEDMLFPMEGECKQLENEFTAALAILNAKNAEIGFYAAALSATQIKIGG
jgi:outer membrane translocation and assembly module TamA